MKLLVTVDSIEGNLANLLLRGEEEKPLGVFPLSALPDGVEVGDILSLHFVRDEEETKAARQRIAALHKKLMERN